MIKAIGCVLIGFAFSWISIIIWMGQSKSDKALIDELVKENKAYKQVIEKWRDKANKTYWG